jgi:hypothetical protein
MPLPLFVMLFAASACTPVDGWNAGRAGQAQAADCAGADYAEAWKLGDALHQLVRERSALEAGMPSLGAAGQGAARRRQRQLDTDIEALHGVATVRGWPYEGAPSPEKSL